MKNLSIPVVLVALAMVASCGASKKDQSKTNNTNTQSKEMHQLIDADTIKVNTVEKSEDEWAQILTPDEFSILRKEGTEPAFSSELNSNKKQGIYYCAACGLPLYSSKTKFKSGTGWPSFYQPIDPKVVEEKEDRRLGMVRTEIECAQCGSHIGHVFKDGPEPTGLRYCMNGLALKFKAKGMQDK